MQACSRRRWKPPSGFDETENSAIRSAHPENSTFCGDMAIRIWPPITPKWGCQMWFQISNGHISATGHPIYFMFRYWLEFWGRRIEWHYSRLGLIQLRWRPATILDHSNCHISVIRLSTWSTIIKFDSRTTLISVFQVHRVLQGSRNKLTN